VYVLGTCDGGLSQRYYADGGSHSLQVFNATAGDAYRIGKAALAMQLQPAPAVGTRWN
jgi:hypothetical protein